MKALAGHLNVPDVVLTGEHHLAAERIRPDYAVHVQGAIVGFVELKAPGTGVTPARFKGHNRRQWERLACLPNLLYCDGGDFALYRDGEQVGTTVRLVGDVASSGSALTAKDDALAALLDDFLGWTPVPPKRPRELARVTARLCRVLRAEVRELLDGDAQGLKDLAKDWRRLLYPDATDDEFADGYAQTVTFALLLARVENVAVTGRDLRDVADDLGSKHTLMARALSVLTDKAVLPKLTGPVETLRRILGVTDWATISRSDPAAWLYFYEDFLEHYDPALRKLTGSYYTPIEAVDPMVRLVDDLLRTRLGHAAGFASPDVTVVDPAVGTGTFLFRVIGRIAQEIGDDQGPGAVGPALKAAASRLVGFELQAGPFSVAELRLAGEFARHGAALGTDDLRLYLTDTLANPYAEEQQMAALYRPIAESRRQANTVKRSAPVVVVLGNPPYKERSRGTGSWVEQGDPSLKDSAPLLDFMPPKALGLGAHVKHLYNPYVFFWRWATWKVFETHPGDRGVVAFITVAGFLNGPGFAQMRAHLRRWSDEIWVVDCSPEGHQPEVATRIFQGVQQPICITIAVRDGSTGLDPAPVRYTAVSGTRAEKFAALAGLGLDGDAWQACGTAPGAPFLPAGDAEWTGFPALDHLLAWSGPGVQASRTWVIGTSATTLVDRAAAFRTADDARRTVLLPDGRDRRVNRALTDAVPGYEQRAALSVDPTLEAPVRYGARSLDRGWIVPDKRVISYPRPELWQVATAPGQTYLTGLEAHAPTSGPATTCTALVPDLHHYRGSFGGRAFPLWLDAAGTRPNVAPGLLALLAKTYGTDVCGPDLFAYIVGLTAHPAYTSRFHDDLLTPGLRIPLTADADLFEKVAEAGRRVTWLHTYGERCADPGAGRPVGSPRITGPDRPTVSVTIPDDETGMPEVIEHEAGSGTLLVGDGRITGVTPSMWSYDVSGYRVIKRWFDRRKRDPDGRRSSPLDEIVATTWSATWTTELLDLLHVVGLLRAHEPHQAGLLERVLIHDQLGPADLTEHGVLPAARLDPKSRPLAEKPPPPGQLQA